MSLNLSLASSSTPPAAIQWSLSYSTNDFTSATLLPGSAGTGAGKQISCNSIPGNSTCLLWGVNSSFISNGVAATVVLSISPSTQNTSSPVLLSNGSAAALDSTLLTATTSGTVVTIVQPPPPTWTISGAITGASGATVTLTGGASAVTTTDASGNYSFTGLANGSYTVTPSKNGFAFNPANQLVTISSANVTSVNFMATALTWSISGTISPATSAKGATITLSGAASAVTTADASGNYNFSGLANGSSIVTPSKAGYVFSPPSQSVTISGSSVTGANFTVQAVQNTWIISGTVNGGGQATVALSGTSSAMTTSDGSGNYSFSGLTNGSYTVTPAGSGFMFKPTNQTVTINGANVVGINFTANAAGSNSTLSVNYNALNYARNGSLITSPQTVTVNISPAAAVAWTATSSQPNIVPSPSSGVGSGMLQITASPGSSGVVTITATGASNSPQQIQVNIADVTSALPFGSFDSPLNNSSGIAGAIAVTGWALDNIEVSSVGVWREPVGSESTNPNGLVYIGNAIFVPGARPDVQTTYAKAPWSYRGGWGYMLLTNFLPNSGNGTYRLHAIAVNKAGAQVDFGARVITVDNMHATKPFGTIDTPDQGGSASGNALVNFGWALTQNPNFIPLDGSTITVILDGVAMGHPTYNQYRTDIAALFPGLANSNGAVGFFILDTTQLANGLHSIAWVVSDNAGRQDGIGSRYFNVLNGGAIAAPQKLEPVASTDVDQGFQINREPDQPVQTADGTMSVEVEELDRVLLPVDSTSGYLVVAGEQNSLPIGSTLKDGIFYWQLGPGFLGDYFFVFNKTDGTELHLKLTVQPARKTPHGADQ